MEITPEQPKLRKLVTLANFLDDLPHDSFHIAEWTRDDWCEESCGTAGCVAGWAATIFRRDGCHFKKSVLLSGGHPYFNGEPGSGGFSRFFGISQSDARLICIDFPSYKDEYGVSVKDITPRIAADRIRKVVARYDASLLEDKSKPVGAELAAIK